MIKLNGTPINITKFPDGTSQVWKLQSILDLPTQHVVWEFENEAEFMHLAQLKCLLDYSGHTATLVITFLPYARQDKPISNESTFALHPFAMLLNTLQFDKVTIYDPHSKEACRLIDNSQEIILTHQLFSLLYSEDILVCYPDKGALSKYSSMIDRPYVYGDKVREQSTGKILSYNLVGEVSGKHVLIVDDICDGGMTFKLLAEQLYKGGATQVDLYTTHGIYSQGTQTLFDSNIKRVFNMRGEVKPNNQL